MLKNRLIGAAAAASAITCVACGSTDPAGSGGDGTLAFTTWGEELIEVEIPADLGDGSGFIDGWTVSYDKFLVNFRNIVVADSRGETAVSMDGAMLFDNTLPGVKAIAEWIVPAQAWDRVSYDIAPVDDATVLAGGATEADEALMVAGGYSLYASGTATKDQVEKRFSWGFAMGTRYSECQSEQGGAEQSGVVVTNNTRVDVQLTTHGDHLFYDRLQASPDPAVATSLRFDALAATDADEDGEITLAELEAQTLDVRLYDPSGLGAVNYRQFVTSLARTVGHFRGEGECTVSGL